MYTDILHHIERLQIELANADPEGTIAPVSFAVAKIAEELRHSADEVPARADMQSPSNG